MASKDINLTISSSQLGNDSESIEIFTDGKIFSTKDSMLIEYDEYFDNGSVVITNSICVNDDIVTLSRSEDEGLLVFQKGKSSSSSVSTNMGIVNMTIFSHELSSNWSNNSLNIYIKYSIDIQGDVTSHDFNLVATYKS